MTDNVRIGARAEKLLNFRSPNRLPVILQAEGAECGLACMAMILGYYGHRTDLPSLRRRFSISSHGISLKALMDIAAKSELATRALKADPEDFDQITLPCIVHWGLNHFVVLKKITNSQVIIHDPAVGERKLEFAEFDKMFTGVLLELTPTQNFEKGENTQTLKISHFWDRITGLKRHLLQIIALSLVLQVFALIAPLYMQVVVDDVLLKNDENLLLVLAIGFGLLMLISVGTDVLRQFIVLNFTSRLTIQMSANLFRHLIRLPMTYFSSRHMGDVVSRFSSLDEVRSLLTNSMVTAVVDGVMASLTLLAMFIYNWVLGLIVTAVVVIYALLRWIMYRPFRLLNEEVIVAEAKENSHFMESVRAIQTIKLFQKETDRQHQWQNNLASTMNKEIRIARWDIGYSTINNILFGLENIVVIYVAATVVMAGGMSLGMLFVFMSYKVRFVSSINSLIDEWIQFKMLDLHLNRLADIVHTDIENVDQHMSGDALMASIDNSGKANELGALAQQHKVKGKIEVIDLGYRYSQHEPFVFRNVNMTIEAGETVAIVGPSGCGKSTILKCLMGLVEPTEGEILIDGKPLAKNSHFRSQIASVMQDDQLLAGDIAENIACFATSIDMKKVTACAQLACISEDIDRLAMGYQTLVGDMGSSLSGGQKQRVILARALYRRPRILFMDEATSHLDEATESVVNRNIGLLSVTLH